MTFGKSFSAFTNKIGKAFSGESFRQLGNSVAKTTLNGLKSAADLGGQVSGILGKAQEVTDGLRGVPLIGGLANVVGGGISQAKGIVNMARQGVDGLEKIAKSVSDTADKHSSLGRSIMSGDTNNVISAAKDFASVAQSANPFKK